MIALKIIINQFERIDSVMINEVYFFKLSEVPEHANLLISS